jgi:hypothetical protein
MNHNPISDTTWRNLIARKDAEVREGWAAPYVFAPAIGVHYSIGAPGSLLYVGKSAGPKGKEMGLVDDQSKSIKATSDWMREIETKNPNSNFWHFITRIDRTRESIAWTNVSKYDKKQSKPDEPTQPDKEYWTRIRETCLTALREEITYFQPRLLLFAIGDYRRGEIQELLASLDYVRQSDDLKDDKTECHAKSETAQHAIITWHPQGKGDRWDTVATKARQILTQ